MKKIVMMLWAATCCLMANAENKEFLQVTFHDGQNIEFALAEEPIISFADDLMKVTTKKATFSYELWTVSTFHYSATSSGIAQTEINKPFFLEGNNLIIDGTENHIRVYTIDGRSISLPHFTTGGKTIINIDAIKGNVLLIHINGKTIKIVRS